MLNECQYCRYNLSINSCNICLKPGDRYRSRKLQFSYLISVKDFLLSGPQPCPSATEDLLPCDCKLFVLPCDDFPTSKSSNQSSLCPLGALQNIEISFEDCS